MPQPRWLVASIVGVVASTTILSMGWVGICTFVVGPKLFEAAIAGKIKAEPKVCDNVEERAIQVMTGLLATLAAMLGGVKPPEAKP